jgi:TP901 family phage tail tape measure protein
MGTINSSLIISLIDRVSGPAKNAAQSLRGIGTAAKALNTRFGVWLGDAGKSARRLNAAVGSITGALSVGAGGLGAYKLHHDVMEFAKATNRLAAANPDIAAAQIERIKALAREITRTSLFDPATVMNAANALARADVSVEAIEGALKPLSNAAMAADVPVSQLADDFVKLASGFGLAYKTKDQARETFSYLGDLAQYVSQKAPGTFTDFVQAMKYVGPSVRALGVDIKWLAGAYIMLDKAGIRNAEAGTALRSLFKYMVQPTLGARGMYAQLGIDTSEFTKRSDKVTAAQLVKRIAVEYGKDFTKLGPELQRIMDSGKGNADIQSALVQSMAKSWGDLKPQDRRKLAKTVNAFLSSATEEIDPEKWLNTLVKKGVTFGQLLQLIEPKQALRLRNLMNEQLGEDEANKKWDTPLSQMLDFKRGLADEAASKMMQGYPAAIAKLSAAWHTFIESLDKSGVIDRVATMLVNLGEAIARVFQGKGSFGDWAATLTAAVPVIAPLTAAAASLAAVLFRVGAGAAKAVAALKPLAAMAVGLAPLIGMIGGTTYPNIIKDKKSQDWLKDWQKKQQDKETSARDARSSDQTESGARINFGDMAPAGAAGAAGEASGSAFREKLNAEMEAAKSDLGRHVQEMLNMLNFNASPTVTPKLNAPTGGAPGKQSARDASIKLGRLVDDTLRGNFLDHEFA